MKKLGLFLLLILVVGLLSSGILRKGKITDQESINKPTSTVTENEEAFENAKKYKLINCPEITDIANETLQSEINERNKEEIDLTVSNERMDDAIVVESFEEVPNGPYVDWLGIDCKTIRNDSDIFSQKMHISTYGAGAAHSNYYTKTVNYSVKSVKELSISSLFKQNTDYLKIVTNKTRDYLKKKYGTDYHLGIENGTSKESNFSAFLVEKNGLIIIFDPYQVAPYSEGTIEVLLSRSELGSNYLY